LVAILSLWFPAQPFSTIVTPRPGEDFAPDYYYDLTLPAAAPVRAAWVTFDRGKDIMRFSSDAEVVAFARQHSLALMMPHQSPAKSAAGGPPDLDMDRLMESDALSSRLWNNFARQSGIAS